MSKACNQKIKILFLMDLLKECTDAGHVLPMKDILGEMEKHGISAARKSVYDDIETLKEYGLDIEYRKERPEGYYLASHSFELPELKLLVDAVQSSKFITERKSRNLIKKIEGLSSKYEAACLQRQVFVADRIKTMNESIYYNVDKLHTAISGDSQITFQYTRWTIEKKLEVKNNGELYQISPWALAWENENYYLIGYDEGKDKLKHFRVDKMLKINILEEKRIGKETFKEFDLAVYSKKTFGMFSGREEILQIRFPDRLIGVVIDRFGQDTPVRRDKNGYFLARVQVAVSEQFFGWLTGLGKGVIIVSPKMAADEYKDYLGGIMEVYI